MQHEQSSLEKDETFYKGRIMDRRRSNSCLVYMISNTGMFLRFGMCGEADISSLPSTGRGSVLRGADGSDRFLICFRSQGDKMAPELSDN